MEFTKQGAQGLQMKMQNAELYLNEATVTMPSSRLQQDCPN